MKSHCAKLYALLLSSFHDCIVLLRKWIGILRLPAQILSVLWDTTRCKMGGDVLGQWLKKLFPAALYQRSAPALGNLIQVPYCDDPA